MDRRYWLEPRWAGEAVSRPLKATTANVTAGSGSAVVVLIWLAGHAGVDLPAEVAGALVVVISVVAGWLVPSGGGDHAG